MSQSKRKGKSRRKARSTGPKEPARSSDALVETDEPAEAPGFSLPEATASDGGGDDDGAPRAARRRRAAELPADMSLPLDREKRDGRIAGAVGALGILATFVAIGASVRASGDGPKKVSFGGDVSNDVDKAQRLKDYAAHDGGQALAAILHAGALLTAIVLGFYLCRTIRARNPELPWYIPVLTVLGPLSLAVAAVVGYLGLSDVADTFTSSGSQSVDRADDLLRHSNVFIGAQIIDVAGHLVFAVWLGLLSREAMRVSLLSVFLGIWGVGSAVVLAIGPVIGLPPIGESLYIGWYASLVFLAFGYWPDGRPEGWTQRITPAEAT